MNISVNPFSLMALIGTIIVIPFLEIPGYAESFEAAIVLLSRYPAMSFITVFVSFFVSLMTTFVPEYPSKGKSFTIVAILSLMVLIFALYEGYQSPMMIGFALVFVGMVLNLLVGPYEIAFGFEENGKEDA